MVLPSQVPASLVASSLLSREDHHDGCFTLSSGIRCYTCMHNIRWDFVAYFFLSLVYGSTNRKVCKQLWDTLPLVLATSVPWLIIGHFNETLGSVDKRGGQVFSFLRSARVTLFLYDLVFMKRVLRFTLFYLVQQPQPPLSGVSMPELSLR